jgi:hypothetical protein
VELSVQERLIAVVEKVVAFRVVGGSGITALNDPSAFLVQLFNQIKPTVIIIRADNNFRIFIIVRISCI